jgi:DNA-binding NarL/FixJ family response regulator
MTTVVVADDQEMIRLGLKVMLESRGITVLGEATDGREAVAQVRRHRPDVILMDVRMPALDGIAATQAIVREGLPTQVLIVTTYDVDDLVYQALRSGAAGFMLKSTPADQITQGVELVAAGEALLSPTLTRRLIEHYTGGPPPGGDATLLDRLTDREREVLRELAQGLSNQEIAAALVVSVTTVKTHINRIFAKLHLESRVQAVVAAYESGLVVPGAIAGGPSRPP